MFIYGYMAGMIELEDEEYGDEDFDPHKHRHVPHPTTYWETFAHMLKGSLGAGILAMPYAMAKIGILAGLIGLTLITFLATYSIHVLIIAQYRLCKRNKVGYITYPQSMSIGTKSGPPWIRWTHKCFPCFVDSVLVVWQLGLCCVYTVFIAQSIKQVCDFHGSAHSIRMHMCFILLPLILINLPKGLKVLAPVSTIANVVTFVALSIAAVYLLKPDSPGTETGEMAMVQHLDHEIPVFVGITLFALEAVGVILALEYNMTRPELFVAPCGLLNIGMLLILLLYGIIGFLGYKKYGPDVGDTFTYNLPNGDLGAQTVKILFALALLLSYPLQNFVAYEIIWRYWAKKIVRDGHAAKKNVLDYSLRVALVLIPFAAAVAMPHLGPVISLFGALCLSNLGIIFPAILDLSVRYPNNYGWGRVFFFRDYLLIILGAFALFSGTYTSILDIAGNA